MSRYAALADEIVDLLGLSVPPIAIAFRDTIPDGIARYRGTHPPPTENGRTGAVAALKEVCEADRLVAAYASEDGKRFA